MKEPSSYLLILGDRQAIAWVLREQRMAFPPTVRSEITQVRPGDELLIYTTRGAYRNPTRDRGRIIGRAVVTTEVRRLDQPVHIAGRDYPTGCDLRIDRLAPWGSGVELQPLVARLDVFPNPAAWSIMLRRALLRLPADDAVLLRDLLAPLTGSRDANLSGYLAQDRPPVSQSFRRITE
ncbi:hypothetical protein IL992_22220 [Microbispora sp. NEAU-D428]|uniref:hypothetical protein n=1 Tax=Microbispora sitophila TaxID=2771537 RepID=UPI00186655B9|nr:hypothetical protein [Microbispora sitophila]MBE3011893.1 hypothetical protein [Microbispora sitophila]